MLIVVKNFLMWIIMSLIFVGGWDSTPGDAPQKESFDDETRVKLAIVRNLNLMIPIWTNCMERVEIKDIKKMSVTKKCDTNCWQEVWTVQACKKNHDFEISFNNSSDTTDFLIRKKSK